MALGICMKCLKYLVFVINLLFWLAGMGLLAASIYIRCYPDDIEKAIHASADHTLYTVTYIFMALGGLMTVVGFLGCCGAYQESPCIIASFIILLILILLGEIAGIVAAYMLRDDIKESMDEGFMDVISTQNPNDTKSKMLDWLQEDLHCCGATKREDWVCSTHYNAKLQHICQSKRDVGIGGQDKAYQEELKKMVVPDSCCKPNLRGETKPNCGDPTDPRHYSDTFSRGCSERVMQVFGERTNIILGITAGIIVLEILILAGAFVLCCSFRRHIDYDGYRKP